MNKINIQDIEAQPFVSPQKKYATVDKSLTEALTKANNITAKSPFEVEHVTVPPGKKAYTFHAHATQWEFYYAVKGTAKMRLGENVIDLQPGDAVQCPPGTAHQLINNSDEDFEYLIVASNPDFDMCYYPDSDKVMVHPLLGANKDKIVNKRGNLALWTKVQDGLITDYWHGEE